jgi:hypothetical protein
MRVPILTALTDARSEAALVGALESADHGVTLVRRCVDLADLVSAASAGTRGPRSSPATCAGSTATRSLASTARASPSSCSCRLGTRTPNAGCRQLGVAHLVAHDAPPSVIAAWRWKRLPATPPARRARARPHVPAPACPTWLT